MLVKFKTTTTNTRRQATLTRELQQSVYNSSTSLPTRNAVNSPDLTYLNRESESVAIHAAVEAVDSKSSHFMAYPPHLSQYLSKSGASYASYTRTFHKSTPQAEIELNMTSVDRISIVSLPDSSINIAVSQFPTKNTEIHSHPTPSASFSSLVFSNNSLSTPIINSYTYITAFATAGTVDHTPEETQVNATHGKHLILQTETSQNYNRTVMSTTQLQNSSLLHSSKSTLFDRMKVSSHTPSLHLVSMNQHPSKSQLISLSTMLSIYSLKASESDELLSTKPVRSVPWSFLFTSVSSTSNPLESQKIAKVFQSDNLQSTSPLESFSASFMTPTMTNPTSNVNVKEKNKKNKGSPDFSFLNDTTVFLAYIQKFGARHQHSLYKPNYDT